MNAIACGVAKEVACNFAGRIKRIRREEIEKGTKMLETSLRSTIAETMKKVQGFELRTEDYLILVYIEIHVRNHHSKIYHQRKKLKNMNLISTDESSHDRNSI